MEKRIAGSIAAWLAEGNNDLPPSLEITSEEDREHYSYIVLDIDGVSFVITVEEDY